MTLKGKKILLGITGSIAAYKTTILVRLLIKAGAEVKVLMTPASKDFVSPLVLSTLSKNEVFINLFDQNTWSNHVMLGRWADVVLIAPLSCNTLAKMATGQCDNLLLATYLSATCPVVVAPAMDEDMWNHSATKNNILQIESFGNKVINVDRGELASGLYGEGRMAEPEDIVDYLSGTVFRGEKLSGKKVLITAGPTYEAIDPVRFIGNHSSGKMGFALAQSLYLQGADVTLVTGPTYLQPTYREINVVKVITADQMYDTCAGLFDKMDIAIMAAAVADYKPMDIAKEKIKKSGDTMQLNLIKNKDILKTLGTQKKANQLLIGFALETSNEEVNALEKLKTKHADIIVLNSLRNKGAGFGVDTNDVIIFDKDGMNYHTGIKPKEAIAEDIVQVIIKKIIER